MRLALISALLLFTTIAFSAEPRTVERVELASYLGLWHEVARIPNDFQDKVKRDGFGPCRAVTAQYDLRKDGSLLVQNSCLRTNARGDSETDVAIGIAKQVRGSNGAKLKVNFTGSKILRALGIGNGNYWILGLGPIGSDGLYSWVLVGEPKREYGWILARDKNVGRETSAFILSLAAAQGYDPTKFKSFE